jgi:hypothetical protein
LTRRAGFFRKSLKNSRKSLNGSQVVRLAIPPGKWTRAVENATGRANGDFELSLLSDGHRLLLFG